MSGRRLNSWILVLVGNRLLEFWLRRITCRQRSRAAEQFRSLQDGNGARYSRTVLIYTAVHPSAVHSNGCDAMTIRNHDLHPSVVLFVVLFYKSSEPSSNTDWTNIFVFPVLVSKVSSIK